jgi:excinuclease ABC subunit C
MIAGVRQIDYIATSSEREALVVEQRLINKLQPIFNTMWKDDKSYPFIVLTMTEDFPRLRVTREKKKKGNVYFGPYPSVHRVRRLLRWTWRKKFFPLRPCNYEFSEKKLLPYNKVKSCLYLHTEECPAPCIGRISVKKYGSIAERAKWFFQGKKGRLIKEMESDMARLSKEMNYEEAGRVRDRISSLQHIDQPVAVNEITENSLEQRVGDSRAVQELMQELSLPRPPHRIECFDISHVQGVEKVASMVSFKDGRPDKSNYRKFIIRSVEGIDDFKSMAEVVGRRYRRLRAEKKPFPDLILIDGGKGQLSSALDALEKEEIKGIPIAALAKEEEEIFLPGRPRSVRLPMDSAGLLLLRYVRDEAHRFAITFHRLRRGKRTLKEESS